MRAAVLVGLLISVAIVSAQDTMPKELAALQGRWVLTSIGGQVPGPSDPEGAFMVTGDQYVQAVGGRVVERGTLKIDASKKPVAVDFLITVGRYANTTQLGIVEVTGDTVRFHLGPPGGTERPPDFKPREGFELVAAKKRPAGNQNLKPNAFDQP